MPSVILTEVDLSFGDRDILKSVNLSFPKGRKLALAGANGSGKSTLMRIVVGELAPDSGKVMREKGTSISYMPQSGSQSSPLSLDARATVIEEVEKTFAAGALLVSQLRSLEQQLGEHKEQSAETNKLLERHHSIQERLESSGYHRREETIGRVLRGLGFRREEFEQRVGAFSQGWQMRIALARVLCQGADVLLLDEPTNFLDIEARTWLEGFIQDTDAGVLVVSHDRYFLDSTINEVAELYQGGLKIYPGSFSSYERRRIEELAQIAEAYEQQQSEIARMQLFIRRFRYKATKARQVQSRINNLERMQRIEPPPVHRTVHLRFPKPPHSGKLSLQIDELDKTYGSKTVFQGVSLTLSRGEKWALVGPNGAGKSTLMRIMAGREKPDRGTMRQGSGISIGYYCPEEVERLEDSRSVEELAESWAPTEIIPQVRSLLGAFLFRADEVFKPVSVLSGGEKSRLALLRLMLEPANMLFLDEPTNHLDLQSKDVLLDALRRFAGTVVFVSHDRRFIEALADHVVEIENEQARTFPGDYAYYLWRKQREEEEQAPEPGLPLAAEGRRRESEGGLSASQRVRLQDKAQKRDLRRLLREEEELLARLDELQEEHGRLEGLLAREEVYRDGQKVKRIKRDLEELTEAQNNLMRRWEQVDKSRRALESVGIKIS